MTLKKRHEIIAPDNWFLFRFEKKECLYKIIKYITTCEIYKIFSKYLTHCKLRY